MQGSIYTTLNDKSSSLTDRKLLVDEVKSKALALVQAYPLDQEDDFVDELNVFSHLYRDKKNVGDMLQSHIEDKLSTAPKR